MDRGDLDRVLAIAAALPTAPHWERAVYEAAIADGARRVALIAEVGGLLAGFAVVGMVAPEAELESIAVAAGMQRSGVGAALVARLKAELRMVGVESLDLEVRESNGPAAEFYRRAGFREVGRRRAYYCEPVEDAVLLRLTFEPE
jgi:ribosomal-protein-alanine N-acetyltransferase